MYDYIRIRLQAMVRSERGASAVEYGLLVALLALGIIGGITMLKTQLNQLFSDSATALQQR